MAEKIKKEDIFDESLFNDLKLEMNTDHEKQVEKHLEEISNNLKFLFWVVLSVIISGVGFIALNL